MPMIQADDGVRLYAESTGSGTPMLFIHEFAGDHRSWEPQVQYFSAALECITYSARGYPPSDVPADPAAYSQQRAVDDAISVLDALGVRRAARAAGPVPARVRGHRGGVRVRGRRAGGPALRGRAGPRPVPEQEPARLGPVRRRARRALRGRGRADHARRPGGRPSLYALATELAGIRVPVLIMTGDEDEGCLEPALMLKRAIPGSGLSVLPQTGHTANLEDPAAFNREVDRFLAAVDRGAWRQRDPRSLSASTTGMTS